MQYSLQKVLKKVKKLLNKRKFSSSFFLYLGIFLILFGGINYYRVRRFSFNNAPKEVVNTVNANEYPTSISIPSIEINLSVEAGNIKDGVWQTSLDKVTFLSTSQVPGKPGNIVLYGHNKKSILGNLPYLSIGQQIILKNKEGREFKYEVYKKDFVGPDRIDLVSQTENEELTIYTCWGILDNQRVVVKAKPIK